MTTQGKTQRPRPTIYYIQENEKLQQKIEQLQRIISELTAQDNEPLPFTSGEWGA